MTEPKPTNARTVSTDALETLGKIHTRIEHRDAIHLAVEPVVAGESLWPNARITVIDGVAWREHMGKPLGIVDPFLDKVVEKGERFWFVMFPRAVHSLRHVWTHPSFPNVEEPVETVTTQEVDAIKAARAWLEKHAADLGFTYDQLMGYADVWVNTDDYTYDNTERYKGVFNEKEFWANWQIVTGRTVDEDKRECFFTCSC